jgi:hypothetical protein
LARTSAGKYALYTIRTRTTDDHPLQDTTLWGADKYTPAKDVLRVKAKPLVMGQRAETFTIDVGDIVDESATLWIAWDQFRGACKDFRGHERAGADKVSAAIAQAKRWPAVLSGAPCTISRRTRICRLR